MASYRTLANIYNIPSIDTNNINIRSSDIGLSIYNNNISYPLFQFDTASKICTINADLVVNGDATFTSVTISTLDGGIFELGGMNPGTSWDLGIVGIYNPGVTTYSGIVRVAADPLNRWTFFDNITTPPTTIVSDININTLASVALNKIYANSGSDTDPSITFYADNSTGLYYSLNTIGFTANNTNILTMTYNAVSDVSLNLTNNTTLKLLKINTINDITSNDPLVTTGNVQLESASGNDKWFSYISYPAALIPAYSGVTYSSNTTHYIITNTGSSLSYNYNTNPSIPPDFRDVMNTEIFNISNTRIQSNIPIYLQIGNASAPSLTFTTDTSTGLYYAGANAMNFVCSSSIILQINPLYIKLFQRQYNISANVSQPAITFTTDDTTGFYYDSSGLPNMTLSISGIKSIVFQNNSGYTQTLITSGGTKTYPSFSFIGNTNTGIYLPTDTASSGQIAISLNNEEVVRYRNRTSNLSNGKGDIEFYNYTTFTTNGSVQNVRITPSNTTILPQLKATNGVFKGYSLIDTSIISLFTFYSTSPYSDYSGNSYNASPINSPPILSYNTDGNSVVKQDVLNLTGNPAASQYLSLTPNLSAYTSLDNVSISLWFRISGTLTTDNTIFNCYGSGNVISIEILSDADTYSNALQVTVNSDSLPTLQFHTATAADSGSPSIITVKDGNWHHVVIQLGSGSGPVIKQVMYFNGQQCTVANSKLYYTATGDNPSAPEQATNSFDDLTFNHIQIGSVYNGVSPSNLFTGYLKDIYITGRILTTTEITTLYTTTNSYFDNIYANSVTVASLTASNINISSQLFGNGSAANPSVSFTNDTSTGMYLSSAGVLGFSTSGIQQILLSSSIFSYNTYFNIDPINRWLQLKINSGASGAKLLFSGTNNGTTGHYITTNHDGTTPSNNYFNFYLSDTTGTLGTNNVARLSQSAAGPNTALLTVYGQIATQNGTVSSPAYTFSNYSSTGIYASSSNEISFSINSTQIYIFNTTATFGTSATDTSTKLYLPRGTNALPTYSFIGNTATGIYSSALDNIDFSINGTNILNLSSQLISQIPVIIDVSNTSAFIVRQDGAPSGGTIFSVDTTNSYIGYGFTSLYLSRYDAYNNTIQRLKYSSSSNISQTGVMILNESTTTTGSVISTLTLGKNISTSNYGTIGYFHYADGDGSNSLYIGMNGSYQNQIQLTSDGQVYIYSLLKPNDQVLAISGSPTIPSYSFVSDSSTGLYYVGGGFLCVAANGNSVLTATDSNITLKYQILGVASSVTIPSYSFDSITTGTTGFYDIPNYSGNVTNIGVSNEGVKSFVFNGLSTGAHQSYNQMDFYPDGTNITTKIKSNKIQASANQTILNILPIIHYKFLTAPASNLTTQDDSINKYVIKSTSASYTNNVVSLTDLDGIGLLSYNATQFTNASTNRLETLSVPSELLYLSSYQIMVKFKLISTADGSLFEIYGNSANTSGNYITLSSVSSILTLTAHNGTSLILSGNIPEFTLFVNYWYTVIVIFTSSGNVININGVNLPITYSVGTSSTTITPLGFSNTTNLSIIVGGITTSILGYIAEFYIAPTITTETANIIYPVQTHEIYTNKLQLGYQNLVDEGYILRSDKGNTVIWDNSIQIQPNYIKFTKYGLFSDGSVNAPSLSFSSDSTSGIYRIGSGQIGITLSGTLYVSFSTTSVNMTNGQTLNVGSSGTTSPLNVRGLITGYNGLTISSGTSSLQAVTAAGLITANLGLTVTNGQTLNVGTSGTTSPLNIFGLITGNNGLTISSGTSSLQAVTAAGLITANLGLNVTNGQTLNVGTSGTTSPLNVFGLITGNNGLTINSGMTTLSGLPSQGTSNPPTASTLYVNPPSLTPTANPVNAVFYYSYFSNPTITKATAYAAAAAYTIYVAGAPVAAGSVTITNTYALYIASGITKLADTTSSTSSTTGAFIVTGGAGIGGNLYIGGNANITGNAAIVSTSALSFLHGAPFPGTTGYNSIGNSQAIIAGTGYTYTATNHSGQLVLLDNADNTVNGSNGGNCGSIVFAGPAHNFGTAYYMAAGRIRAANTAGSFGGTVYIESLNGSGQLTSAITINSSQTVTINSTTNSTSSSSGACVINGGAGIANALYVGSTVFSTGGLSSSSIFVINTNGNATMTAANINNGGGPILVLSSTSRTTGGPYTDVFPSPASFSTDAIFQIVFYNASVNSQVIDITTNGWTVYTTGGTSPVSSNLSSLGTNKRSVYMVSCNIGCFIQLI